MLLVGLWLLHDVATDFSLTRNPNGPWEYGYSATASLAPDQFRRDERAEGGDPVGFWHPSAGGAGYYPYIAHNTAKSTRADPTNSWALRAGQLAMEASNGGQYSLIRFNAPAAGDYHVKARFEGIHFRLSTTDVHVLLNAASVFDADIDGYGGDPAFHAVQGASPVAAFSRVLHLERGDVLTFAVGYGKNHTHYNDTTGLSVRIRTRLSRGACTSRGADPGRSGRRDASCGGGECSDGPG